MALVLVSGGTRSGKSEVAERLVAEAGLPVVYVATGAAGDPEMKERIARHRARRPAGWTTLETGDPAEALARAGGRAVLVDSLGGWVAALMAAHGLMTEEDVAPLGAGGRAARAQLLQSVASLAAAASGRPEPTVVVAEEAGLGPVPEGALTRRYLDLAGEAAQVLSAAAARALLVVAGRALELASPSGAAIEPELRFHGDQVARGVRDDHAVSIADEPRPAWLGEALAGGLRACAAYPDERPAREAIAARHGRSVEEVVLTNGANESFWLLGAALRAHHAVCVHPSYTEPEAALRTHGVRVERVLRRPGDFALDPPAVPPGADLVVVGNPNNPTGNLEPTRALEELARAGRALVVDEAFMDFVPGEAESLAARRDVPGAIVVRSLTKLWSLPGVRAGYLLAPARLARAIERIRPGWNVNSVALEALRACAGRVAEGEARARRIADARGTLQRALERMSDLQVWPSAANFLLAGASEGARLQAQLLRRGIGVRPCTSFPGLGPEHFRVAVRSPAANRRLVRAIAEVVG